MFLLVGWGPCQATASRYYFSPTHNYWQFYKSYYWVLTFLILKIHSIPISPPVSLSHSLLFSLFSFILHHISLPLFLCQVLYQEGGEEVGYNSSCFLPIRQFSIEKFCTPSFWEVFDMIRLDFISISCYFLTILCVNIG